MRIVRAWFLACACFVGLCSLQGQSERLHAWLKVETVPDGAAVMVNGTRQNGKTPLVVKVSLGSEAWIEVEKQGFESFRLNVTHLQPGITSELGGKIRLKRAGPLAADKENPWRNGLGMPFVPVGGTEVLFCVWETRVQDFELFVNETEHDATGGMYSLGADVWKQRGDTWRSPGFPQGGDHPVVGVSYEDAVLFCQWLTEREQREGRIAKSMSYRLPTDWEWTKAVGDTKYPWGNEWPPPKGAGNYAGEEAKTDTWLLNWVVLEGYRDGWVRTSPVGRFEANENGLYDMGGNVWEWCEDWYRREFNTKEIREAIPLLDKDYVGTARVLRGASWINNNRLNMQSATRNGDAPTSRYDNIGFRCVLVAREGVR